MAGSPSAADCTTSSARVVALHSYHDGASATQPPDVRNTSFVRHDSGGGAYVSSATETSSYTAGSGRTLAITRGAGNDLVIGYDGAGRRTFDYDSIDPVRSRRDYEYLPNGQLGKIVSRSISNQPYTTTIRYDHNGLPILVTSGNDSNELFWDDSNRLINIVMTRNAFFNIRWHFHYVGDQLIAVTRDVTNLQGSPPVMTTDVKKFWVIADERGLPHRLVDGFGVEFWRASWDASGWRTMITQATNMNLWFGLPGQLIMPYTEAYTSGTIGGATQTWYRAPIALNQWRAYDALTGSYLQPDDADRHGRLDPEGYVYSRSSPVESTDVAGARSAPRQHPLYKLVGGSYFNSPCAGGKNAAKIQAAVWLAIMKVAKCTTGWCGNDDAKTPWLVSLMSATYYCPEQFSQDLHAIDQEDGRVWYGDPNNPRNSTGYTDGPNTELYPAGLNESPECLAALVAHERLHAVQRRIRLADLNDIWDIFPWSAPVGSVGDLSRDDIEDVIDQSTSACFDCPPGNATVPATRQNIPRFPR